MSADGPKTLRELRGTESQFKLAVRVGLSPSTIAGIEQGRHEPKVHAAIRIAQAFMVRVEDIAWPEVAELEKHRENRKKDQPAA